MKKILISCAVIGGVYLAGILSVGAISYKHHDLVKTNCSNCGNYIDENNDCLCDNCLNQSSSLVTTHHHHNNHDHY